MENKDRRYSKSDRKKVLSSQSPTRKGAKFEKPASYTAYLPASVPLTKASLEPIRDRVCDYIMSLPGEKKIEQKYVMKVKGKCLNSFLGILKSVSLPQSLIPKHTLLVFFPNSSFNLNFMPNLIIGHL